MNKQGKKDFESPPSTLLSDQQPTLKQLSQQIKRFQRSRHQHSKSKEQIDDEDYQLFYIKNVCTQYLDGKYNSRLPSNIFSPSKNQRSTGQKRQGGNIKIKKQSHDLSRSRRRISEENQVKEFQNKAVSLKKQVLKLQEENTVLKQINERLQQKMSGISDQLQAKINQNKNLSQDLASLELKLKYLADSSEKTICYSTQKNNTKHLKDRTLDKKEVKSKNSHLKKQLPRHSDKIQVKSNEKEVFLEQLVQEMKRQVQTKDDHIKKLRIQLDIFLIKQAKGSTNNEVENSSEMDHLKKKYQRLIKNYADVYQQLNQYRNTKDDKDAFSPDKDLSLSL